MAILDRRSLAFLFVLLPVALAPESLAQSSEGVVGWGVHRFDTHYNDEQFVRVVAGANGTAAFRANGSLVLWGDNHQNQCYPPTLPPGSALVDVCFGGTDFPSIVGRSCVLGLGSNGMLYAWGDNTYLQCNVPVLPPGVQFTSVAAGSNWVLASLSTGSLVAWGVNSYGQLAVPSPPPGQAFVRVAAGEGFGLGLLNTGDVVAWGFNLQGQCNVPALPAGVTYVDLRSSGEYSLGLRSDGALVAWGGNFYGECNVPVLPPGTTYVDVSAGPSHALGLRSDGVLLAWGTNYFGDCDVPIPPAGVGYVQIAAGIAHSVALRSDGRVVCWGNDYKFQCNLDGTPPGVHYSKIACSSYFGDAGQESFALALRSDGEIETWGEFNYLQPTLPAGVEYVDVSTGWMHALALRSDGNVVGWGTNYDGENNVPALPPGMQYVAIAASGGDHYDYNAGFPYEYTLGRSSLLRSDGAVVVFGDSGLGQLNPLIPPPGVHYVEIAAAGARSYGRRSDGSAVGYGYQVSMPALPPGTSWVGFAACGGDYYETYVIGQVTYVSPEHVLGLTSNGQVVAAGDNYSGQTNVPALGPGLEYVQVADTAGISMARRSDGSVIAWGNNAHHEWDVPILPAGEVYTDIACGESGCFARYSQGPACGTVSRTCWPALSNSASAEGASLEASGCAGITSNGLVLDVHGLPPSTLGMFVYGSQQQQVPFGNGWGCISGSMQRVLPPIVASSSGAVSFAVDLAQFPFTGSPNPITPSSGWYFQYVYRDPAGSPASFNASDALHVFFAP